MAVARAQFGPDHVRVAEGAVELARLELAQATAGATERATAHLATAERIAAANPPGPAFGRNLAAARRELDALAVRER